MGSGPMLSSLGFQKNVNGLILSRKNTERLEKHARKEEAGNIIPAKPAFSIFYFFFRSVVRNAFHIFKMTTWFRKIGFHGIHMAVIMATRFIFYDLKINGIAIISFFYQHINIKIIKIAFYRGYSKVMLV